MKGKTMCSVLSYVFVAIIAGIVGLGMGVLYSTWAYEAADYDAWVEAQKEHTDLYV